MKHLFTRRVRTVIIVCLLLAVGLSVVAGLTGIRLPDMIVQGVLTPIRSGVTALTEGAEQFYNYIFLQVLYTHLLISLLEIKLYILAKLQSSYQLLLFLTLLS